MINLFIGDWDYIAVFFMGVWDQYPGELVLFAKYIWWTAVGGVEW